MAIPYSPFLFFGLRCNRICCHHCACSSGTSIGCGVATDRCVRLRLLPYRCGTGQPVNEQPRAHLPCVHVQDAIRNHEEYTQTHTRTEYESTLRATLLLPRLLKDRDIVQDLGDGTGEDALGDASDDGVEQLVAVVELNGGDGGDAAFRCDLGKIVRADFDDLDVL